ncbi:triose-phosphate isomerase [Candidatus Woesearchaeota archaeon]|nr:triose-phosphate isomerase [Candidatus Woesearchaeota archaeon]
MRIEIPLVVVNCKAYSQAVGRNVVELAKACQRQSKISGISVGIAVQSADIFSVAKAVSIPVFAQHVDDVSSGAFTGSVFVDSVKHAGVVGSLVNHSEKPLDLAVIKKTILRLHDAGLLAIACAGTPEMAFEIVKLNPDIVAIEPPELIGGNISVSEAKPEVITATTSRIKRLPVLCGAGIKTKDDVSKAIALGAEGILVASGVVCAKNPENALKDLLGGFVK